MKSLTVRLIGGLHYHPITVQAHPDNGPALSRKTNAASQAVTRDVRFDFKPDPSEIFVIISIPAPDWHTGGTGASDETENINFSLKASASFPGGFEILGGNAQHTRIRKIVHLGVGKGTLIEIDLIFVEVTPYLLAIDDERIRNKQGNKLLALRSDWKHVVAPRTVGHSHAATDVDRRMASAHVRFYELTVGQHPRLWCVAFEKATLKKEPFHLVTFLMPKAASYKDPSQVEWWPLRRYLTSPPYNVPFFVHTKSNDGNNWQRKGQFRWSPHPLCGFAEQLVRSKANAVLVLPVPNGRKPTDNRYGILATTAEIDTKDEKSRQAAASRPPHEKGLRHLLDSLRRAMRRKRLVELWPMADARLAIGGFSQSAPDAIRVLKSNQTTIEQLYWFDPTTEWIKEHEPFLSEWLKKRGNKQLRLIGGNQHSPRVDIPRDRWSFTLSELYKRLSAQHGARVTLVPQTVSEFERSPTYRSAVAMPAHAGQSVVERLHDATEVAPPAAPRTPGEPDDGNNTALSRLTGVFVVSSSPLVLEGRHPDRAPVDPTARDTSVLGCNPMEAVAFMRFRYHNKLKRAALHTQSGQPRMKGGIDKDLVTWTWEARHQWAVCGGYDDPMRNAAFVGYLHDCLKKGKL